MVSGSNPREGFFNEILDLSKSRRPQVSVGPSVDGNLMPLGVSLCEMLPFIHHCNRAFSKSLSVDPIHGGPGKMIIRHLYATKHTNGKGSSSHNWVERQRNDLFVKQAGRENYRCRSAFKLLQVNERFNILKPGYTVIDCGAAPGSWCQVAVQKVNAMGQDSSKTKGQVIGIDLQHMVPVDGAVILSNSDFTSDQTQTTVKNFLKGKKADIVLSDMAPSATGFKAHNHEVIVGLCFSVLHFCLEVLNEGGTVLCKLWQGGEQAKLERAMKMIFESVRAVKPEASRDDSTEIFLLGRGFKHHVKSQ